MMKDVYTKAKQEGRTCSRCGWIVTKKDWQRGERLCWGCRDALHGVNIPYGCWQERQEPMDKTGDML